MVRSALTYGATRSTDFFRAYVSNPLLFPRLRWKNPRLPNSFLAHLSSVHVYAYSGTYSWTGGVCVGRGLVTDPDGGSLVGFLCPA
jgi:hypothetical protein